MGWDSSWDEIDQAQRQAEIDWEARLARIRVVPPEESPAPPEPLRAALVVPERPPTPPPAPRPLVDDRTAFGLFAKWLRKIAMEERDKGG